jgi:perosamine synthetase
MIPRFKPRLGYRELAALFRFQPGAVAAFETAFARAFGGGYALAFPYGRSALWAFFKAIGLYGAEIVQPAYTCSVVAHATVLSGNVPRFVDLRLPTYNMDLDQVRAAINPNTGAVISTHLFGYPLDVDNLSKIVREAEARFSRKIWIIQDCAHAFAAEWRERSVVAAGDVALFGLNISKMITSIFGGMLYTTDADLAHRLRTFRDATFKRPGYLKRMKRVGYFLAVYPAFAERVHGLVHWLQEETPLLNRLTKAYHLDEKIAFPPDYLESLCPCEAEVGLVQLSRYSEIVRQRRQHAQYYDVHLPRPRGWELPPLFEGATYSHYVVRVPDREAVIKALGRHGVQLGRLIEYSVPHTAPYRSFADGQRFPLALKCSETTINLPVYAGLSSVARERAVKAIESFAHDGLPGRAAA